MSNPNDHIITTEVIADSITEITTSQSALIENCINQLQEIKNSKKVTESNLKLLISIWRELDALREGFYVKLFNSMKRGNMIVR